MPIMPAVVIGEVAHEPTRAPPVQEAEPEPSAGIRNRIAVERNHFEQMTR